jgi:hypothetical protein
MKEIMSRATMLSYPKFYEPFAVYTDASEKQNWWDNHPRWKTLGIL